MENVTMTNSGISTEDRSYRKYMRVLDTQMAYVDVGTRRF
jgi:hypothetical protein